MIKAVIFDMYETLITLYGSQPYFSPQMADDAGLPIDKFRKIWLSSEDDRATGKVTSDEVLKLILKENNCYKDELFSKISQKYYDYKKDCFNHLDKEIIPLLEGLKENGIKVGLISNCFSEEAQVIRQSVLFKYFDEVCLSYEEGLQKPDTRIFDRCLHKLNVKADECLYVGDGGSQELETAQKVGMKAVQAVWYLKEGTQQPNGRKNDFVQIENPLGILDIASKSNT